jgi:hypothetical protein
MHPFVKKLIFSSGTVPDVHCTVCYRNLNWCVRATIPPPPPLKTVKKPLEYGYNHYAVEVIELPYKLPLIAANSRTYAVRVQVINNFNPPIPLPFKKPPPSPSPLNIVGKPVLYFLTFFKINFCGKPGKRPQNLACGSWFQAIHFAS